MYYIVDENNKKIGEVSLYPEITDPIDPITPTNPDAMKVALVVGHQSDNKGAYGESGIGEWDFNNDLITDILKKVDNNNIKVFYRSTAISGYTNQMVDLHSRIDAWGAEVSCEFHFNSFSGDAKGHEVLYCSENGKKVATILNDYFTAELPTSNRGVKKITMNQNGGGFCCRGASLAIISEPFFAAYQNDFIRGGKYRVNLENAYVNFINTIRS